MKIFDADCFDTVKQNLRRENFSLPKTALITPIKIPMNDEETEINETKFENHEMIIFSNVRLDGEEEDKFGFTFYHRKAFLLSFC